MKNNILRNYFNIIRSSNFFFALCLAVTLILFLSISNPYFLTIGNMDSLQTIVAPNTIIAIGMMLLIILGMFDLSVGSVMGFAGIVTGYLLSKEGNIFVSIICGLSVGILIGLINGLLVVYIKIPALIATIGSMYIVRGFCEMIMTSDVAMVISNFPVSFTTFGNKMILGLYPMVWICIILLVIVGVFVNHIYIGRLLYYIGGSIDSARSLGMPINRVRMFAFVASGSFAAIAGILSVARFESASRYLGQDIQMNIIIACLIGGGSLKGGKGTIVGCFLGTLFVSLLKNAFNLFEINSSWQNVVLGAILVFIVTIDGYFTIRKRNKLI
jgi:ribose/xylose/arabinose/galactoside ABC-type transport system permease subunit